MSIKKYIFGVFIAISPSFLMSQDMPTLVNAATAQKGIALIVITGSADSDGTTKAMRSLLAHPDILPYRVDLAIQAPNSRLATELKAQTIWENRQSGWAVIGPDGKLVIAKDGLPDLDAVKEILRSTNCPIPLIELQKFYRQNPNRIDILMLVLRELVRIGEEKLLYFYGEQSQNPDFSLPDERDDEFWSEYVKLFRTNIVDIIDATNHRPATTNVADIRRLGSIFTERILPSAPAISSSPNLIAMARIVLQHIEPELINSPYNNELWRFWALFRPNRGGMQIETFVDTVLQNRFREQKPMATLTIINVLQKEEKWRKIMELATLIWDNFLEQSNQMYQGNITHQQNTLLGVNQWNWFVFPLFKACVISNSFGKAEEVIKTWLREKGWPGARTDARNFVLDHTGDLPNENWPN